MKAIEADGGWKNIDIFVPQDICAARDDQPPADRPAAFGEQCLEASAPFGLEASAPLCLDGDQLLRCGERFGTCLNKKIDVEATADGVVEERAILAGKGSVGPDFVMQQGLKGESFPDRVDGILAEGLRTSASAMISSLTSISTSVASVWALCFWVAYYQRQRAGFLFS
ncbi:MAG: hypothetical protein WCQ77_07065 [Planctomycetota bacterium]